MWILAFTLSLMLASVLSPVVAKFYEKRGWLDDARAKPHPKKTHDRTVPRGGGLVIAGATILPLIFLLPLDVKLFGVILAVIAVAILGTFDDILDLNPMFRLPILFLIALIPVSFGVHISYVSNPFGDGVLRLDQWQWIFQVGEQVISVPWVAMGLAVIWIVWNMTVVNWSKGLDGQMPGFVMISAIVIGILSLRFQDDPSQLSVTLLSVIVAGAFGGFLLWNWYPQRLMAGYGAGSLGGFFLAVLSMLSGAKVATALLVLAIPTVDAVAVISRRILSGKSPFMGDRGHLHHRLFDVGWGRRRVAVFYWLTTLLLGILALQLKSDQKVYTTVSVFLLVAGAIIWLTLFFFFSKRQGHVNG